MFVCSSCLRTLTRTLFAESSIPLKRISNTSNPAKRRPDNALSLQTRRYTLATSKRQNAQVAAVQKAREDEWSPEWRAKREMEIKRRDLLTELDYLRDPVLLAQSVSNRLRDDAYIQALDLVRVASSRMSCVVSWNHLIDWNMAKGRVQQALKTYLEMKKRAQPPDAYTFTILFRGLAKHIEYPKNLERALAIYESMYAPNSPVQPNIAHTNAVLSVCAQRADLDTMLGIAARLPDRGPRAADNRTYTLFFNTIKATLWKTNLEMASHMPTEDGAIDHESIRRRQTATLQGRRMWCDVVERWSKNDIIVDEELVCSLGRLLLLGANSRDPDDILSLVEQTMGIERQLPPLSDPKRRHSTKAIGTHDDVAPIDETSEVIVENPDPSASSSESLVSTQVQLSRPSPSNPSVKHLDESTPPFAPLVSMNKLRIFARPGRNTLSLLMDACIRMRSPTAANKYRILLTDPSGPYKVGPDTENLHTYLRLLRHSRSCARAADLVQDMIENPPPGGGASAKTFRIAMSSCVRGVKNERVGEHAGKILHLMTQHLEEPDIKTCEMYINVLNRTGITWRERIQALSVLDQVIRSWRSLLTYGRVGSDITNQSVHERQESSAQEGVEHDLGEDETLPRAPDTQRRQKPSKYRTPHFSETLETLTGKIGQYAWNDVRALVTSVVSLCDKTVVQGREEMSTMERKALRRRRESLIAWIGRLDKVRGKDYSKRIKRGEIAGMGLRKGELRDEREEQDEKLDGLG